MSLLQINYKASHCMPPPPPKAAAGSDEDNQTLATVLGRKRKESPGPSLLKRQAIRSDSVE